MLMVGTLKKSQIQLNGTTMNEFNKGEVSEWNEGTFKTLRLHYAQDLINKTKIFPLKRYDYFNPNSKFNYEMRIIGIKILFDECYSKYAESEYEEVRKIEREIEELLEKNPPCSIEISEVNGKSLPVIIEDNEKWKLLKEKIELYEYKVKFYNDKHGFSTRNIGTKGLF